MILGLPADAFVGITLLMAAFLIAGYLLLKMAMVEAHFEIRRREEQEAKRKGARK